MKTKKYVGGGPIQKTGEGYTPAQNAPQVTVGTPKNKVKSTDYFKAKRYKTGGMTNANAKVSASKVAKGRAGGTSSAPKTAVPKAKMGMSMKRKSC